MTATHDSTEPTPVAPARARILDAAEVVFAASGFDAATTRRIAEAADVPVGLVNYHFGSKLGLYRAIFERRAPTVTHQRAAGLAMARTEPDADRRIELIVKALIMPMLALRQSESGRHFGQLMSRELSDPNSDDRGIFAELFDPVARTMIEAIGDCYPDWTRAEVHWAYQTMLGAMMIVMTDAGRISRLSGGAVRPEDHETASRHIVAILSAGLRHRDRSLTKDNGDGRKANETGDISDG